MRSVIQHCRIRNLSLLTGGMALIGIGLYVLARVGHPIPCVFHLFTGLSCPGCGNTRAVLALLQLDFPGALSYNYLFPLELCYLIWVYLRCAVKYLKTGRFFYFPVRPAMDWFVLIVILSWWIIRNFLHI